MKPTPILFLDLDGTVRLGPEERKGQFVNGPEDVELFDGVLDIMKSYKDRGWRIVAISNQGGIALHKVTDGQVARGMEETNRLCARLFDRMMWCAHHPAAADRNDAVCLCRKPRIGNVVAAMISMSQTYDEYYAPYACLFVGDMQDDWDCAAQANIPFMMANHWREKGPLTSAIDEENSTT